VSCRIGWFQQRTIKHRARQACKSRTAVSISFTDELSRFIQSIENLENFSDSCPFPKKAHSFGGVDEC